MTAARQLRKSLEEVIEPPATIQSLDGMRLIGLLNAPRVFTRAADEGSTIASNCLREWVDEWIDSGYSGDVDSPRSRQLKKGSEIARQVFLFSLEGHLSLLAIGEKINSLTLFFGGENSHGKNVLARLMTKARRWLILLLLSDLRWLIAVCRNPECRRYFLLKRSQDYKRGTKCPKCRESRRSGMQIKTTTDNRLKATGRLVELAVDKFRNEIRSSQHTSLAVPLKKKIASFLNGESRRSQQLKRIYWANSKKAKGVKVNWVTTNWDALLHKAADGGKP